MAAVGAAGLGRFQRAHCAYDGRTFNACIHFEDRGVARGYNVHVGTDVYLPEQYGREIIACGADLKATLRGDDGKGDRDQMLRFLSVAPDWPQAGAGADRGRTGGSGFRWEDLASSKFRVHHRLPTGPGSWGVGADEITLVADTVIVRPDPVAA